MRYGVDVGRSGVKVATTNGLHVFMPSLMSQATDRNLKFTELVRDEHTEVFQAIYAKIARLESQS